MREGGYGRNRIPVVTHALDIPERLKELDEGYFVMLNTVTQRFEIWHRGDGEGALECVLPYDALDERAVRHAREHRTERLEQLVGEIEAHNLRIEEKAKRDWLEEAGMRTKEAFDYLRNKSGRDEIPEELLGRKGGEK